MDEKFKSVIERIKSDENLKKQLFEAEKNNQLIDFFKSLGFDTTNEELSSLISNSKTEIFDSDLDKVSAGVKLSDIVMSVITLTGYCAAHFW